MVAIIQPSFAAGEVSLPVQARVDLTKRAVAVEKAENMMVSVTGSLISRPGTLYVADTYGNVASRLIPFEYSVDQTYVLEFADQRIVVYRDGVEKDSITSPYVIADVFDLRFAQYGNLVTITHEDYAPRELLRSSDTSWSLSTITFEPEQAFPTNVRVTENKREGSMSVTAMTKASPGVATTAAAHGLSDNETVRFGAGVDMTVLQRGFFKVEVLTTTTFAILDPEDGSDYSTVGASTWSTAGSVFEAPNPRNYAVTAVNSQTGEESIVGTASAWDEAITSVSSLTPAEVTTTEGHGLLTGDEVTFTGTSTGLDDERFIITRVNNRKFTLSWVNGEDVDGSAYSVSSGSVRRCFAQADRSLDTEWDNDVYWDKAADAVIYNVYASDGGAYGLIGSTTRTRFRDYFISPDTSIAPPVAYDPFFDPAGGTDRYPRACGYHNQRRVFGYSNDFPNRVWMTQAGNFYNLASSTPTQDDDAITVSIASAKINDVDYLLSLSELIALTGGSEIMIWSGEGAMTPSTVSAKPQSFYGTGDLPPLVTGDVGMLSLANNRIRDFEYTIASQSFVGVDLTILARHLLEGYTLQDWTYAHAPHAVVPISRTDGVAVAFTYFPEQEVYGWGRWVTDGDFYSFCSVKEDGIDRIYAVVKRGTDYFIERFANREVQDVYDYHGVDAGVFYDATPEDIVNMAWDGTKITVTITSHGFSNGDIIDIAGVLQAGADNVAVLSDDWNGDGFVVADAATHTFTLKDSGGSYVDGSSFTAYSSAGEAREAVTTVSGLAHLNGETVVAAANGVEVTGLTVSGGSVTLTNAASRVHVGLPYTCEVITLPVSAYATGGTIEGVMKAINRFALHVISTATFWAGPDRAGLQKYAQQPAVGHRRQCMMNKSNRVTIRSGWDRNRSMMIQQRAPLPMELASIIPDVMIGED